MRASRTCPIYRTVALGAAATLIGLTSAGQAGAQAPPPKKLHTDVRDRLAANAPQTGAQRAAVRRLGARVQFDARFGAPSVVMRDGGALTKARSGDRVAIARAFLSDNTDLFALSAAEVGALLSSSFVTKHSDTAQVSFDQRDGEREVFGGGVKVTVDSKGRVVSVSGTLYPDADATGSVAVDAPEAIAAAAGSVGVAATPAPPAKGRNGSELLFDNTLARGIKDPRDITAVLVSFPTGPDSARPAWKLGLQIDPSADYVIVVDAVDGKVLYSDNGVADADGTVFTSQHPETIGAARSIVPFPATWMTARTTSGPNVNAYQDLTNTNAVGYQPQTPAAPDPGFQRFNFGWANDFALNGPQSLRPAGTAGYVDLDAATTQLFYYTNVMHDYLLGFGFDQAARNFEGNDPVLAEVTDGWDDGVAELCTRNMVAVRCVDNANFNVNGPDGTSPRMQMYMWETPARDGSMDGDVIAHEYGHGLAGRLVQQDGNLGSAVQTGALGEAWSDFTSASKWNDPVIGEYSNGNATTGLRQNSMASSPLKYSQLCTLTTIGCQVHADGEIWAATLWDIRRKLVDRDGPGVGAERAFQLVVDGMKGTAQGPTFLSARDGILAADVSTRAGADTCLLWGAFAAREMGFSAATTGNGDMTPTTATDGPATCTPVARTSGPYTTNEGTDVPLDASSSTETGDGPFTYEWDLDGDTAYDDATGKTPSFTRVGQDGTYTVAVRVTNDNGFSHTASTTVTVRNVAPTTGTITTDAPRNENEELSISGAIADPGWRDELTATIDFGDGEGPEPLSGTLENDRADATLSYSLKHVYGDNGTYTITVCAADDDTQDNCNTTSVRIDNVTPTLTPELGSATVVNGIPTFISHAGTTLTFAARSTDPGSDDLTFAWDYDDGAPAPDVLSPHLVNPPLTDPATSPSIQPRDETDTVRHAFGTACLYTLGIAVRDDDDAERSTSATVLVTANATRNRSAGYWQTQYRAGSGSTFSSTQLDCYLRIVGHMSRVFDERTAATTIALARAVLAPPTTKTSMQQQLDRQLLAAWLNFANGSIDLGTLVDTDADGTLDSAFGQVLLTAESVRLAPTSTKSQLTVQKNLLERINLRDGG